MSQPAQNCRPKTTAVPIDTCSCLTRPRIESMRMNAPKIVSATDPARNAIETERW
jgi:hypothetical protein